MNEFLFELVGPNYSLSRGEIKGLILGFTAKYESISNPTGLSIIRTDLDIDSIGPRLGLTHRLFSDVKKTKLKEIYKKQTGIDISLGSVAVRTRRIGGMDAKTKKIKQCLGEELSKNNPIDLKDPDHTIFVFISDEVYVGRKVYEVDKEEFKKRDLKNRPHFSPVSLKPRMARALINLSRPAPSDRLHDPFCGTGGILLEAYHLGLKPSGGDIDTEMVTGCKMNLKKFDVKAKLVRGDVSETTPEDVDCIVTDPPYGRASSTSGEDLEQLYRRLFRTSKERLKEGGHLSVIFPEKKYGMIGENYLKLLESYNSYVHGSLERHFFVYEK